MSEANFPPLGLTDDRSSQAQTWRGQWLGWLCLAMLVFFTWVPMSYTKMVAWPWITLWQLGFLLVGVWAVWMLRQFQLPFRPLGSGLDGAIGLIALSLILSGIFSRFHQVAAWNISIVLGYGVLLYVLRNWLGQGMLTLPRLWIGLSLVGVIACLVGLIAWWPEFAVGAPRNQYPLGHPNFVAGYVLLLLPLTFNLALAQRGWQRLGGFAACTLLLTVLYSTGSRGGFLGFLAWVLVGVGFMVWRSRGKRRWLLLSVSLLALVVASLVLFSHPRVQQIIQVASPAAAAQPVQVRVDGPTEDRLFMWQASLNILKDCPLLGVGPGNMSRVYNLYRPIEVGTGAAHVQQLHSTPIQIMGELGVLGLSAAVLLVGCLGYLGYRLERKLTEPARQLLHGIGGGLFAYGVSSLTDYQLENVGISGTLVLLVVLLIKLADGSQLEEPNEIKRYYRRCLSLGCLMALTLAFNLWLPVAGAMALSDRSVQYFNQGNVEKAYRLSAKAAELVPWNPIFSLLAGFQVSSVQEIVQNKKVVADLTAAAEESLKSAAQPDNTLLLLQAWIEPEQYLWAYLDSPSVAQVGLEGEAIKQSILQNRSLRDWLVSVAVNLTNAYRQSLTLAYRNAIAEKVGEVLLPSEVEMSLVVQQLGLFQPLPRSLPPLEIWLLKEGKRFLLTE